MFVAGLGWLPSKQSQAAMLIRYIDISRLIIYIQQVKEKNLRERESSSRKRGLRRGMILGSRRVTPIGHPSNRNKRVMLHPLLMHLYLKTRVSTIIRTSYLNLFILRVAWHKELVSLMHAPSAEGITQVLVMRAPLVVSILVRMVISFQNLQRTIRVIMVIGALESV